MSSDGPSARVGSRPLASVDVQLARLRLASGPKFQFLVALPVLAALILIPALSEANPRDAVFAISTTLSLAAAAAIIIGKPLTALAAVLVMIVGLLVASMMKQAMLGIQLHSFDLYQYLFTIGNLRYFASVAPLHAAAMLAFVVLLIGLSVWVGRRDRTMLHRPIAFSALIALSLIAFLVRSMSLMPDFMVGGRSDGYISSFFLSWPETLGALWRGQVLEAAVPNSETSQGFSLPNSCPRHNYRKFPNIILIHQESMVPPAMYPGLSYDKGVDRLFLSDDGKIHPLRVEIYGGGSWLTQVSVLTGLSTRFFGGMRLYLLNFLRDKIRDTLPQNLKLCGYRTIFLSVAPAEAMQFGRFYKSLGFDEFIDRSAQGSRRYAERDIFYYKNFIRYFKDHRASGAGPLFANIETIASHWPYDTAFMPEELVAGAGPGAHPEVNEYMRRMAMAATDFGRFLADLKAEFPHEAFLIVSYGDHRPHVSKHLQPEFGRRLSGLLTQRIGFQSSAFLTYYSMLGINFQVPDLPEHGVLDVPYIPSLILRSAGVPLSDAHAERLRLMDHCGGAYAECFDRTAILNFHRRLLDSGIVLQ